MRQMIDRLTRAATAERIAAMQARIEEHKATMRATGACEGKSIESVWQERPGGLFKKGNPGGPGNPFTARQMVVRSVANRVMTVEDTEKFVRLVTTRALAGDPVFAKMYIEITGQAPKKEPPEEREGDATEDPDFEYL